MNNKMKLLSMLITITVVAVVLMSTSCEKEKSVNVSKSENIRLVTLTDENGFKSGITMLEFGSPEHYDATIASLRKDVENHEDSFLSEYGHLSDDLLNAKENEIGFNTYEPLVRFERKYSIPRSMRQNFIVEEVQWMDNMELDLALSPQKIYPFDIIEMSLLNPDGEVKIGENILKLTSEGFIYIANKDIKTLIRIKNGDMTALKEPTVTTNIDLSNFKSRGDCENWVHKDYENLYASDKKVIVRVHFHAYPWKGSAGAEVTSYKKERNKWVQYRMDLRAALQTYFYDPNCYRVTSQMYEAGKWKKQKSVTTYCASWGNFPGYRVKSGKSVFGSFHYAGKSYTAPLVW